jgi:hypothetical protein
MAKMSEIKTKVCSKKDCKLVGIEQNINNFSFRNKKEQIYHPSCKNCQNKWHTKDYEENKTLKIKVVREHYHRNHNTIRARRAELRSENRDEINRRNREKRLENKDERNRRNQEKRDKDPIVIANRQKRKEERVGKVEEKRIKLEEKAKSPRQKQTIEERRAKQRARYIPKPKVVKLPKLTMICHVCLLDLDISMFLEYVQNGITYRMRPCRNCRAIRARKWQEENKEEIRKSQIERNAKPEVKAKNRFKAKKKYKDPHRRLRLLVSNAINGALKRNNSSKNGESCTKYLPFTINKLKTHLENQFEDWMTWDNHGEYLVDKWNDDDKSTWTWQIDHIKPHSDFVYTSMKDKDFEECWSLDNLRPYSAKQNLLDGINRTRHKEGK